MVNGPFTDGSRSNDGGRTTFLVRCDFKTVNMPFVATVEDIEDIYFQAWKLGVKAVAIFYRDG